MQTQNKVKYDENKSTSVNFVAFIFFLLNLPGKKMFLNCFWSVHRSVLSISSQSKLKSRIFKPSFMDDHKLFKIASKILKYSLYQNKKD